MITEDERFIEIQGILANSDISTINCAKINDLIIELSKEKKQLQQENQELNGQLKKQKEVIDKAIEYINENWGHWCSNHYKYATETINILKGSDKE